MRTIPQMLAAVAEENAGRTAIREDGREITYAELVSKVAGRAAALRGNGVRAGERVIVMLPNGSEFVVSYFAVVTLGAVVVPLSDQSQENELRTVLQDGSVSRIITSTALEDPCRRAASSVPVACIESMADETTAESPPLLALAPPVEPDRDAVMAQFSSGSTGPPKRIARTHANLLFELDSLVRTLDLGREDRFLGAAPFSHVNGLMRSMLASIRAGATLYPIPRFERREVAETIERERISVFIGVPFMFSVLAKSHWAGRPDLSSLRLCVSASAPLPKVLNERFHDVFGLHVRQLYGSTETGTISVNLSPQLDRSLDSVGAPLAGVEVRVLTETGSVANVGELGELAVRSPAAIRAYDGDGRSGGRQGGEPDFRDGWFLTGDIGCRDADGLLYLRGRKKFFINKAGYKIDPREIEELLETHPLVVEAVVVGVPTAFGDERVKAIVVARGACSPEELVEHCRGKVAPYKIPAVIEFRRELPRSPTGKVRRALLVET